MLFAALLHCSATMVASPMRVTGARSTSSLRLLRMNSSPTSAVVQPASFERVTVGHLDSKRPIEFTVNVQQSAVQDSRPPLVLIPPVGVGIDRSFYNRLQAEWSALGAPAAMHAIDLLGTGSATPKPRQFYSPDVWAAQIDASLASRCSRLLPCPFSQRTR